MTGALGDSDRGALWEAVHRPLVCHECKRGCSRNKSVFPEPVRVRGPRGGKHRARRSARHRLVLINSLVAAPVNRATEDSERPRRPLKEEGKEQGLCAVTPLQGDPQKIVSASL